MYISLNDQYILTFIIDNIVDLKDLLDSNRGLNISHLCEYIT